MKPEIYQFIYLMVSNMKLCNLFVFEKDNNNGGYDTVS